MTSWINRLGDQLQTARKQWTIAKLMVADQAQAQKLKRVTFGDIVQQYRKIKQMVASGSEEWNGIRKKLDRYLKNGVLQEVKGKLKFHKKQFIEMHKQIETYQKTLKDVQATADLKWKDLTVYRQCCDSLKSRLDTLKATRDYAKQKGVSEKDLQCIDQKCADLASKIDRHKKMCQTIVDDYLKVKERVDLQAIEMNKEDFVGDNRDVQELDSINSKITKLLNENVLEDFHDLQVAFVSHLNKPQAILAQHQESINKSLKGIKEDHEGCESDGVFLVWAQEYLKRKGTTDLKDYFGDYILEHSIPNGNLKNNCSFKYLSDDEAFGAWGNACANGVHEAHQSCCSLWSQYETLSSAYETFQTAVAQMTEALVQGTGNFDECEQKLNDALGQLKGLVNANSSDSVADNPKEIVERFSTMLQAQREESHKKYGNIAEHVQEAMHADVYNFLMREFNECDKKKEGENF